MKVGVLGGGQLGRMLGVAGLPLALEPVFWEPEVTACAGLIGNHLCSPYDDAAALAQLVSAVDVCTYEFENVPSAVLKTLAAQVSVYPPLRALEVSQDRLHEKQHFASLDIPTAPYVAVDSEADLHAAVAQLGLPAILKTRRFGYDGKGQFILRAETDIAAAWQTLGGNALILEGFVRFQREVSIIAVRAKNGDCVFYPLSENVHRDGILFTSRALLSDPLQKDAEAIAKRLLDDLDYVGVLCLELFDVDGALVVNEFAPRVHNSGHWTIEGAETSQFENHLRAVADLPLGDTACVGFPAMVNIIGTLPALGAVLQLPQVHVHFYGKSEKPLRKIGHITIRANSIAQREEKIAAVLQLLTGESS